MTSHKPQKSGGSEHFRGLLREVVVPAETSDYIGKNRRSGSIRFRELVPVDANYAVKTTIYQETADKPPMWHKICGFLHIILLVSNTEGMCCRRLRKM